MNLHIATPIVAAKLGVPDLRVWLKLENLQPTGSFKLRGIARCCLTKVEAGAQRLISSSGGNAGLAVAYAGRKLGVPVTVFVPTTTSERAKSLISAEGATVVVSGQNWNQANDAALSAAARSDAFIHPFDDPLVWEGHSTLVDEISTMSPRPEVIVCSVGGGGLLCGILIGLNRLGWADVAVVAVETEGAASFSAAMRAGRPVDVAPIKTIASSLGAASVCAGVVKLAKSRAVESLVITDRQALQGSLDLLSAHGMVTEPACGASIAALSLSRRAASANHVLAIVCGGVGATAQQLLKWEAEL